MTTERPYSAYSIDRLELVVGAAASDVATLHAVLRELSNRRTSAASRLRERVQALVDGHPGSRSSSKAASVTHECRCEYCRSEMIIPEAAEWTEFACPSCKERFFAFVTASTSHVHFATAPIGDAIVCLDFGTSSIRAASRSPDAVRVSALELGAAARSSIDDMSIPSAVLVSSDGREVFFGEEAVERGRSGAPALLFEQSPKRWLTSDAVASIRSRLDGTPALTRLHLLAGLAGYALAAAARASKSNVSDLRRSKLRIAHPIWSRSTAPELVRVYAVMLARASVWMENAAAACASEDLVAALEPPGLLARTPDIDVLEPIAAALELFANFRNSRELCAVIDVGAGTMDLGLFTSVTPDSSRHHRKLVQIAAPRSIYSAGDRIDAVVLDSLLLRGGARDSIGRADLERRKRSIKEALFKDGAVVENGARLTLSEVEKRPEIRAMVSQLRTAFCEMVQEAGKAGRIPHDAGVFRVDQVNVVFAGGGAAIGFLRAALPPRVDIGRGVELKVNLSPAGASAGASASRERMAVALGGTATEENWPRPPAEPEFYRGILK